MEMRVSITKFDVTAKKVVIGIEIEELNEKDMPVLLNIVRKGNIQRINLTDQ